MRSILGIGHVGGIRCGCVGIKRVCGLSCSVALMWRRRTRGRGGLLSVRLLGLSARRGVGGCSLWVNFEEELEMYCGGAWWGVL